MDSSHVQEEVYRSSDWLHVVRILLWLAGIRLELIGGNIYEDRKCKRSSRIGREKWSLWFWTCRVGDAYETSTWRCPGSAGIHEFGAQRRVLTWKCVLTFICRKVIIKTVSEDEIPIEDIGWEEEWAKRGTLQTANMMNSLQHGLRRSSHRDRKGLG